MSSLDVLVNQIRVDSPLIVAALDAVLQAHNKGVAPIIDTKNMQFIRSLKSIRGASYEGMEVQFHDHSTIAYIHPALAGQKVQFLSYNAQMLPSVVGDGKRAFGFTCKLPHSPNTWKFAQIPVDQHKLSAAAILSYPFNLCFNQPGTSSL